MWGMNKPTLSAGDAYKTCISRVRNRVLKARLQAILQEITDGSDEYDQVGQRHAFHEIDRISSV